MHLGQLATIVGITTIVVGLAAEGRTQEPTPLESAISPSSCSKPLTAKELVHMSPCELETLYRQAVVGPMPVGYYPGKAIWEAGTKWTVPLAVLSGAIWQGKDFDPCTMIMTNKNWVPSTKAKVFYGPSWLDGQTSIIMDYAETSKLVGTVRDEIREIQPGLYLGIMYVRRECRHKFRNYFVLEGPKDCCHVGR